jgi:hypothetical protein
VIARPPASLSRHFEPLPIHVCERHLIKSLRSLRRYGTGDFRGIGSTGALRKRYGTLTACVIDTHLPPVKTEAFRAQRPERSRSAVVSRRSSVAHGGHRGDQRGPRRIFQLVGVPPKKR